MDNQTSRSMDSQTSRSMDSQTSRSMDSNHNINNLFMDNNHNTKRQRFKDLLKDQLRMLVITILLKSKRKKEPELSGEELIRIINIS